MTLEPDARSAAVLDFFKALADESRLRLVGLLAETERSVDDLAAALGLRAPTVSHHLNRLKAIGLVQMRPQGTTHLYRLNTDALRALSKQALSIDTLSPAPPDGDPFARKVLRDFLIGERLTQIPASRRKRDVVLRYLADRFTVGERYSERQVNTMLARHHPDTATLRRELVDARLLRREHSVYWREPDPA